jgi:hypothetical protein
VVTEMWKDEFISIRNEYKEMLKSAIHNEETIDFNKKRIFEFLNSDKEDDFIFGGRLATFFEDTLNEQEKEKIKDIVILRRRSFRKPQQNLGYHFLEIDLWLELCDMLDIEPNEAEMEIYREQRLLSSEEKEEIKEFFNKAVKLFEKES